MNDIDKDYACAKCGKQPIECKCTDDAIPKVVWCVGLAEWNKLVDEKFAILAKYNKLKASQIEIKELSQNGINAIDSEDKKCDCCKKCEEGFCPLLALFEQIKEAGEI